MFQAEELACAKAWRERRCVQGASEQYCWRGEERKNKGQSWKTVDVAKELKLDTV